MNADDRTANFRFDDSQEFDDHHADPNEWNKLASKPDFSKIIADLRNALPKTESDPINNYSHWQPARSGKQP